MEKIHSLAEKNASHHVYEMHKYIYIMAYTYVNMKKYFFDFKFAFLFILPKTRPSLNLKKI